MQIDRRITNGLAWAGVVLVIGIPVADVVSAQLLGDRTPQAQMASVAAEPVAAPVIAPRPATRPVAKPALTPEPTAEIAATPAPVAPVTPRPAPAVASTAGNSDVVDSYLRQGKALPSYISGGDSAGSEAPASADMPASAEVASPLVIEEPSDPVTVAGLPTPRTAPMPMPLSMRPAPRPTSSATVTYSRSGPQVVIPPDITAPATVTADDLQDWESGPLSEFLARRQATGSVDRDYDPDGFFLDEGPNGRRQRDRLIGPAEDFYFPFVN